MQPYYVGYDVSNVTYLEIVRSMKISILLNHQVDLNELS